jgi:AraC-like DNA-binding protein
MATTAIAPEGHGPDRPARAPASMTREAVWPGGRGRTSGPGCSLPIMVVADTRVVRHSSEAGAWERVLRRPDPRLAAYVDLYEGYVEATASRIRRRELPSGRIPLILNLGPPWEVGSPGDGPPPFRSLGSFAAGLHDSYALVESTGAARCMQVTFTPIGGYLFLGVPMHSMTNRSVDLDDVLGAPAGRRLAAQLYDAPDWEARFAILDSVIAARLANARPASPGVTWAWRRLQESAGAVSVGRLAGQLGWSRKHLIAQFREQVGLPPKALARVLRFDRAITMLEQDHAPGRADIAYRCGYYDQAHFNRDFRSFAGITPSQLLRDRIPDGGVLAE